MRIKAVFIAIVLTFNLYGQVDESIKDGFHQFKYPNGTISSEGIMKNGKPDGFWKSYYITGVLKSEGKRTSFLLDSIWTFYDQSGDTLEKINYILGKRNGYYYKYQKDPVKGLYIVLKELYAGDVREGMAMTFYPGQKVKQMIPYYKGKKDGLSKEYDREGKVITLFEYRNDLLVSREKINEVDLSGQKQGKWLDFFENGDIKTEKNFKNDQLHGYYKEYNEKGKLVLTLLYDTGKISEKALKNGSEIEVVNKYNDAGRLIYSGPFKDGVPVGIHREYDGNGLITNSKIYVNNGVLLSEGIIDEAGNRNGRWKDFSPAGIIVAEGEYNDNRRTGIWKFYNKNGKLEQNGTYNNGRINGTWRWYYSEGQLLREEDYYQGKREGQYTEYAKDGQIIAQGLYTDGERNGIWKFKNGDNTEEGNYLLGLCDGLWKEFYSSGSLRYKGTYLQGNPDGKHLVFFENGKVMEERYYKNGLRNKSWKKFNETGEIILTITYRDDVETSVNGVKLSLPVVDVKLIK